MPLVVAVKVAWLMLLFRFLTYPDYLHGSPERLAMKFQTPKTMVLER
jgi:hypothetical protein